MAGTVLREFGHEAYMAICRALASEEADKAEAVYRTVAAGLSMKK